MQSKGRARAKLNASYIILLDNSDEKYQDNLQEFDEYENVEKVNSDVR